MHQIAISRSILTKFFEVAESTLDYEIAYRSRAGQFLNGIVQFKQVRIGQFADILESLFRPRPLLTCDPCFTHSNRHAEQQTEGHRGCSEHSSFVASRKFLGSIRCTIATSDHR